MGAAALLLELPDETGRTRTLADLTGERGLYLLFVRSVVWCPFCQAQLLEVSANLARVEERGLRVAAVSREETSVLLAFSRASEIGFPLLSDADSAAICAFGLLDDTVSLERGTFGIPYPGVIVLNLDGRILSKHFHQDYRRRFSSRQVLSRSAHQLAPEISQRI